jgi:hypothetical protein
MLYSIEELSLPLLKSLNSESASFSLQYRGCTLSGKTEFGPSCCVTFFMCQVSPAAASRGKCKQDKKGTT